MIALLREMGVRIHRRYANLGGDQGNGSRGTRSPHIPIRVCRVYDQLEEVSAGTTADNRVFGTDDQYHVDGPEPTSGEDKEDSCRSAKNGREELEWWDNHMRNWNGKTLLRSEIDLVIDSDASLRGWGAACQDQRTGGPWSAEEENMHINCLELLAATLAVETFTKDRTGLSVLLRIDNTTAVAYINNLGGTVSRELLNLAKDLWMWCLERNIHITVQHLPGVMNHIADAESRTMRDRLDWKLNPVRSTRHWVHWKWIYLRPD